MTSLVRKLLGVSSVVALAACSDSSGPDTARLSILLTDAPGDVLEAVVTIDQIYLQGGSADAEEEAPEGSRLNLLSAPVTVDLLTLADEWMTLVGDAEIPAGHYGQLRFVVSGAYLRVEEAEGDRIYATSSDYEGLPEGAEVGGNLQTPSFLNSGLKVSFQGGLTVEGETAILVDFDVSESFGKQAGNNLWVMHPVLKGSIVEPEAAAAAK